jgi:hypothetical protein
MVTDDQIRTLAYTIWEEEGCPDGKDLEHYLRAKKILEDQGTKRVFEVIEQPPVAKAAPPAKHRHLTSPPNKRSIRARHKKR